MKIKKAKLAVALEQTSSLILNHPEFLMEYDKDDQVMHVIHTKKQEEYYVPFTNFAWVSPLKEEKKEAEKEPESKTILGVKVGQKTKAK